MTTQNMTTLDPMEALASLCKRRGFVFPSSEIYGGLAGAYDYGPLGVLLKKNIEKSWTRKFVEERDDMFMLDASILMSRRVWEASGHADTFADPMIECLNCHSRFRFDNTIDIEKYKKWLRALYEYSNKKKEIKLNDLECKLDDVESIFQASPYDNLGQTAKDFIDENLENVKNEINVAKEKDKLFSEGFNSLGLLPKFFAEKVEELSCQNCENTKWSESRSFNMMLTTKIGASEDSANETFLRPETAQGIFVNFKNVLDTMRPQLPFGIAQIGKAFRNEITPRNFLFRVREFDQMEIEYFVEPEKANEYFEYWRSEVMEWLLAVGLDPERVHENEISAEDRAHYSDRTIDFEFDFPFGRKELYGLANRTCYDLEKHMSASGEDIRYTDPHNPENKFLPYIIEPSVGVGRILLAILASAYRDEVLPNGEARTYLKLPANLAPYTVAVSPLVKNKPELVEKARHVYRMLKLKGVSVAWDDNGNVGKRYRRQDEIGTPFCIVIDFDTLTDDAVTVRDRDTMEQERTSIENLISYLEKKLADI